MSLTAKQEGAPSELSDEMLNDRLAEIMGHGPQNCMYEDELPDYYPYDAMFPFSWVDGVRLFPGWDFVRGYFASLSAPPGKGIGIEREP